MASRKTYFGIGLPKDPTDPPSPVDAADQSSPTVVDDEKVAEGLKQLRSWYSEAPQQDDTRKVVAPPVQASAARVAPQARPTAVGHATNETPPETQRPVAPDPMRATMFGHDVHRFDLEAYMAANASETPPTGNVPPPAEERPYRRSDPPRQAYETRQPYEARHNVDAVPRPVGSGSQSGASQLADFLRRQAERPNPAAFRMSSLDDTDSYPSPRVPMSARIVLVAGLAALTLAVVFWIRSRSNAEPSVMPGAPIGAPVPAPPAPGLDRRTTAVPPVDMYGERRVPALRRPPSETAAPAIPAVPSLSLPIPGEAATVTRRTSAAAAAPAAAAKVVRRTHVATAPRPSDAPETPAPTPGAEAAPPAKNADENPAPAPAADHGTAATPRSESIPPPSQKVRQRRPAERDNDATLPPSTE